jgi:hypothetical protein
MSRFEVRYSVLGLISRLALCVGFALFFWFVASLMRRQGWFTTMGYTFAAIFGGMALTSLYRLLTARDQVVISIDEMGFKDIRLTPTLIPWTAILSVWPYTDRSRKTIGIVLKIDPAFTRGLSIRLGAKLYRWANLSFGSVFNVETRALNVEADEISRVAESYVSKQA